MASDFWIMTTWIVGLVSLGIPLAVGLLGELWYFLAYQKEFKEYQKALKEQPNDVYLNHYPPSRYYFGKGFSELSMESIYMIPSVLLCIAGGACALIFLIMSTSAVDFKNHEDVLYEKCIQERAYVQNVVDKEKTIVRETVIEAVLEYNEKVIEYRTNYNSGKYTSSFSGKYDWNELEPIVLE